MIRIGIDVSKEKSTVCILKPYGVVVRSSFERAHIETEMFLFVEDISSYDDEVKIVMEATESYHYPILSYLKENGFFVSVTNPFMMKKYVSMNLRKGKTDKMDSIKIANYGIDNWFK